MELQIQIFMTFKMLVLKVKNSDFSKHIKKINTMMKFFLLFITLITIALAEEDCSKKREQLKTLKTQKDAENVGQVISWLTLTKPTSSNKKILDQHIQILKFEIQECDMKAQINTTEK